jgi:hypothetical protein
MIGVRIKSLHLNFNLAIDIWPAVPGEEHDSLSTQLHTKILAKHLLKVSIQRLGPALAVRDL